MILGENSLASASPAASAVTEVLIPKRAAARAPRPTLFKQWLWRYRAPMIVAAVFHAALFLLPAPKKKESFPAIAQAEAAPAIALQAIAFADAPSFSGESPAPDQPAPSMSAPPPLEKPSFALASAFVLPDAGRFSYEANGAAALASELQSLNQDWLATQFGGTPVAFAADGRSLATIMPDPFYPERARQESRQGVVELKVVVNPDGTPHRVDIARSSNSSDLDAAARNVVLHRWRFRRDDAFRVCTVRIAFELTRSSL